MTKKNGGPAFPIMWDYAENESGMSLRDYFATHALSAMILKTPLLERLTFSDGTVKGAEDSDIESHIRGVARAAWDYADAMIAEREK